MGDNGKNAPGGAAPPPTAASQTTLKSVVISGTNLRWTVGEEAPYLDAENQWQVGVVQGLAVVVPPPAQQAQDGGIYVQINIIYDDYRDLYICADHLVLKNLHVSAIAVVQGPKLVVPGH